MTDMEILQEMVHSDAFEVIGEGYNKRCVELIEHQTQNCSIKIRSLPDDALVIKVDTFPAPKDFFTGKNGMNKRADYVIISHEKRCIIYIEMKKTKEDWKYIIQQLQGAQCVMEYCKAVGKIFWKKDNFLKDYVERFVSLRYVGVSKRPTRREKNAPCPSTPENALKINGNRAIFYNEIACLNA